MVYEKAADERDLKERDLKERDVKLVREVKPVELQAWNMPGELPA